MILLEFPACITHDLSNQLPSILKSQTFSAVLEAMNTSNLVRNWRRDDFFTEKSSFFASVLSPRNTCHLLWADSNWSRNQVWRRWLEIYKTIWLSHLRQTQRLRARLEALLLPEEAFLVRQSNYRKLSRQVQKQFLRLISYKQLFTFQNLAKRAISDKTLSYYMQVVVNHLD